MANGRLDASFSGDGRVVTSFSHRGGYGGDYAYALAVQSDDRIVAVGGSNWYTETSGAPRFGVARYMPNGNLDASFGDHGKVQTTFAHITEWATSVTIGADGRIVAAGRSDIGGGAFVLARYLAPQGAGE
jgi:uncharacterized delta-60 repeat protein